MCCVSLCVMLQGGLLSVGIAVSKSVVFVEVRFMFFITAAWQIYILPGGIPPSLPCTLFKMADGFDYGEDCGCLVVTGFTGLLQLALPLAAIVMTTIQLGAVVISRFVSQRI